MKSIDVGRDFSGQMAVGNILNVGAGVCPGKDNCPYERSEAERQREFEKLTGIACSAGARRALQHLLDSGAFDYKRLQIAWRANSLEWDMDTFMLNAKVSKAEFYYGCVMMLFGFASALLGLLSLIYHGDHPLTIEQAGKGLLLVSYALLIPFSARYMVRPNRIAKRAKPLLQEYYAQPH